MPYTVPANNAVDFALEVYTVPANNAVDFEFESGPPPTFNAAWAGPATHIAGITHMCLAFVLPIIAASMS